MTARRWSSRLTPWVACAALGLLTACGGVSRPKPAEIVNVPVSQNLNTLWSSAVGPLTPNLWPVLTPDHLVLANQANDLLVLRLSDGSVTERLPLDQALSAGVGSDGIRHAVVTRQNTLLVISKGKEVWRQTLPAQVFTPPLVAGERVFVLLADRSLMAFDAKSGLKLWTQSRPGDPLVLRQPGTLMAYQNTLVAGLSGRLTGFDPTTGQVVWDAPFANSRGLNDLERLVDVVGATHRHSDTLCARAYFSQVACIDANRGQVLWSRSAQGDRGLTGLAQQVVGVESNGLVVAWQRANGDRLWESDRLKYRRLSAPLATSKAIWIGDEDGQVYLMDPQNGQLTQRLRIDGSALAAPPLQRNEVVFLATRNGTVRAIRAP